jgi:hypothetical protein
MSILPLLAARHDCRVALDDELFRVRFELDPELALGWEGTRAFEAVVRELCTVRATSKPACRDVRAIFSAASMLARTASSVAPRATSVR